MKKEVEILFELKESKETALEKLLKFKMENAGVKNIVDTYFYDPLRTELQPDKDKRLTSSFRVRNKEGVSTMTYKEDKFDGETWLYSDEYEIKISDSNQAQKILEKLGLKELVKIDVNKTILKNERFEVVIEEVKDLGLFLEVEWHEVPENLSINSAKQEIRDWVKEAGLVIGDESNMGKPELMLRK